MYDISSCKRDFMLAILVLGLLSLSSFSFGQAPTVVGEVRSYNAESPHPYPRGDASRPVVWQDVVVSPDAEFIRLHFRGFAMAPGDYVTVSNPDGSDFWVYEGRGSKGTGDFWSFAVQGDTAIVEVHGGPRNSNGYRIDALGHGSSQAGRSSVTPEVVCGTDGRQHIACHSGVTIPEIYEEPVARLLFISGPFMYACTGWLIDGENDDTLITNNHCISKQSEVDTLQASYNYQRKECDRQDVETEADFTGGQLLITNNVDRRGRKGGLDYSLLTLLGNPAANWGELKASTSAISVNDPIWFIQHPGGRPKEVGYWEGIDKVTRCHVDTVDQTYGRSAVGSQVGYACDSEGGSSGSPIILDADTEPSYAIALHHFGGVNSSCLNSGTSMADICADAGSLLNCIGGGGTTPPPPEPEQCVNPGAEDVGEFCASNLDCCSDKCKGKPGSMTCK